MRNVKNDQVLIHIAGRICIYLSTSGNNAQLLLKVPEPRAKHAGKAAGSVF